VIAMPYASIEAKRAAQQRYNNKNKEKRAAYREANREEINLKARERHARIVSNPEEHASQKARRKEYYEANKSRLLGLIKQWQVDNPERTLFNQRNRNFRRKYGISEPDYQAMIASQNGACAICLNKDKGKRLAVDHCHKTGRIRQLLCGRCNGALGWFEKYRSMILKYADTNW
jgi:hypothetical protein